MLHTLHSCSCKLKCATKWKWSGRRWRHGNKEHQLSSRKMYLLLFACHFSIIIVLLSTVRRVAWCVCSTLSLSLSMLCTHQHSPFFFHIAHFSTFSSFLPLSFSLFVRYATRLLSLILLFQTPWWWWCWGNWESITSARTKAKKCKLRNGSCLTLLLGKGNCFGFFSHSWCALKQPVGRTESLISWINCKLNYDRRLTMVIMRCTGRERMRNLCRNLPHGEECRDELWIYERSRGKIERERMLIA